MKVAFTGHYTQLTYVRKLRTKLDSAGQDRSKSKRVTAAGGPFGTPEGMVPTRSRRGEDK
jgi:hypothetical protein